MLPPVYVLIGGQSTRFGVDKATYEVDGEPWALHVGRRLAASDAEITLVGTLHEPDPLAALRRIDDSPACEGPLAGVLAALEDRGTGLLTLASCDLLRPKAEWLKPLLLAHAENKGLDAAAYHAADRWQPFPSVVNAAWAKRVSLNGGRSLQSAYDAANTLAIPWEHDPNGPPQANTPEELAVNAIQSKRPHPRPS